MNLQNMDKSRKAVTGSCDNKNEISFSSSCSAEESNETEGNFLKDMSLQAKLEYLKQTLKSKIQQLQDQEALMQELECELKKTKRELSCFKEKSDGQDQRRRFIELERQEAKLQKLKEVLLRTTFHLEKALKDMTKCQECNKCVCKSITSKEGDLLHRVKRDLEAFKPSIKEFSTERQSEETEKNKIEDTKLNCEKKRKILNAEDMDNFRIKAVIGVATLEEMREQIDILHELIRNYYEQLPSDYEKGQIEECENKFDKLHVEFDEITYSLCSFVEKLNLKILKVESESEKEIGYISVNTELTGANCNCKSKSNNEGIENVKKEICNLKTEQKRLEKEICHQENYLDTVKKELREVEMELLEKKCQSENQEKEMKIISENVTLCRDGIRGFRERLKDMQIDIAENLDNKCKLNEICNSFSSFSILSEELQELYGILTSSQILLPDTIEKCKEDNKKMKDKLECLEKCLNNKEETLIIVHETLKVKENQLEDLNNKNQYLDSEVTKLEKEIEEKNRLICNLQDSMRKSKEFEMKIKDESIEALQIEICELDSKFRALIKQVAKKEKDMEDLHDEILYVSSKNYFLNCKIDLLEPKMEKMRQNLSSYEEMVNSLQEELQNREYEVETLFCKVKELEQELECELKKCEQRAEEDMKYINELTETIKNLHEELKYAQQEKAIVRSKSKKNVDDESQVHKVENKLQNAEKENKRLINEFKTVQYELRDHSKSDESCQKELDNEGQELCQVINEKQELLESVDELQNRLEEICIDSAKRERENKELREEIARLKKELKETKCELSKIQCDFENLKTEYSDAMEKLKCAEKKKLNLEKLYCCANKDNIALQVLKQNLEKEISKMQTKNNLLNEKILCTKKQKEKEIKKFLAESNCTNQEKMKLRSKIKELTSKMKNLEEKFIPQLEEEIGVREQYIENYKIELKNANISNQKLREDSLHVVHCTKKYLAAQRCANEASRFRSDCQNDNRHFDNRELDKQLKEVLRMNDNLYFELQNENDFQDTEPRSYSPLPWGCSYAERDESSPELLAESGFQSMQQSPTNMSFTNDYNIDIKRQSSLWNNNLGRHMENNDFWRSNSVR